MREQQLSQFVHSRQVKIFNDPDFLSTFPTEYSQTWIDVTLASETAWSSRVFWEVRDTPTLSDHRYVFFGMEEAPVA